MALLPTGVFLLYFRVAELFVVSFGLVVWMCFTWIPYFTGRRTNTGVMLNNLGPTAYQNEVVSTSRAVKQVEEDITALDALRAAGITHIYLGVKGSNFAGPGLDRAALITAPGAQLVHESQNVAIFALGSADGAD